MMKTLLYVALLCICLNSWAQESRTYNVVTPGTLSQLIPASGLPWEVQLTITGNISHVDLSELRKHRDKIAYLDLSNATINGDSIPSRQFYWWINLDSVKFPPTITKIGSNVFYSCAGIKKITIPPSVTEMGDSVFYGTMQLTEVKLPPNLEYIGSRAFMFCMALPSIELPSTLKQIGKESFYFCQKLSSLSLPASVNDIDTTAFLYCPELTSIDVDAANPSYSDIDGVLYDKNQTTLMFYPSKKASETFEIPNTVKIIRSYALYDAYNLKTINIPASVEKIYEEFLRCNKLTAINVNTSNPYFYSDDGILFNKNKTVLIRCPSGKDVKNYTIPSGVVSLRPTCFYLCDSLQTITIPTSVTNIGNSAFYGSGLTVVEIPPTVTSFGSGVFAECVKLKSAKLPASYTSIPDFTFGNCFSLESFEIPLPVVSIGSRAFSMCRKLKTLNLHGNIKTIGEEAFKGTDLSKFIIPPKVSKMDRYALSGCPNLRKVIMPSRFTNMHESVFNSSQDIDTLQFISDAPFSQTPLNDVDKTTCLLLVPAGSLTAYRSASYWGEFTNIEEYDYALTVSEDVFQYNATENTSSFRITSNTEWKVLSDSEWLTTSDSVGIENQAIQLSAEANTTSSTRTGIITVKGLGVDEQTITVTQQGMATGLSDAEDKAALIYPGSVTDYLTVENANGCAIRIFNIHGQAVISLTASDDYEKIQMTQLPAGIYLVQVGNRTTKVIKQ